MEEDRLEFLDILEGRAVGESAAGLDGDLAVADFFGVSPASGGVEVF